MSALSAHGWSMGLGQQDSHELFFVLMTSLEEQTAQVAKSRNILALLDKDECEEPIESKEDNNQNESVRVQFFLNLVMKTTCFAANQQHW